MPTAKVGDINIYYEVHGEGEPLVLIVGYGGNSRALFLNIPAFSKKHRVVVFDNRGTGLTDKPDIHYTIEMMADDTTGLLDSIGIDVAHILGISMGGFIAQNIALRYPDRVISLVLACTHCGGTQHIAPDPEVEALLSDFKRAREILSYVVSQQFIDNNPDIVKQVIVKRTEYPTPLHGYTRQREAIAGHNTYDRLPEIKAPTLVIAGDADKLVPVANSRILADRIPDAELVLLENMGHGFSIEAADEFHKTVIDFLKRHPRSS